MKKNQMKVTKINRPEVIDTTQNGISKGDKVALLTSHKEKEGFFTYGQYLVSGLFKSKPDLLFFDQVEISNELTNKSIKVESREVYPPNTSNSATSSGISLGDRVVLASSGHRVDDLKAGGQFIVAAIDGFSSQNSPSEEVGLWDEEYSKIKWYKLSDCRPIKSILVDDNKVYEFGDIARLELDGRIPIGTSIVNVDTSHTYVYKQVEDGTNDFRNATNDEESLKGTLHNFTGSFLIKIPVEPSYFVINPLLTEDQMYLNFNRHSKKYMAGSEVETIVYQTKFRKSELNALKRVHGNKILDSFEIKEVER